jgi:putative colanic acid biosynthesis UDP-glucose lipid carrier transferase
MNIVCIAIWVLLDVLWLAVGAVVAHIYTYSSAGIWLDWEWAIAGFGCLALLLSFGSTGVYAQQFRRKPSRAIARVLVISTLWLIVGDRFLFTTGIDRAMSFFWLDLYLFTALLLMIVTRMIGGTVTNRLEHAARIKPRVIVAGDAKYLDDWLSKDAARLKDCSIVAKFSPSEMDMPSSSGIPSLHGFENLAQKAACRQFDELWLALPISQQDEIRLYLGALQFHFVNIRLFAEIQDFPVFNPSATTIAGTTFIDLVASPDYREDAWLKSMFDRVFAASVLLCLSPLLATIALLVKVTSPGPMLFRQRRKGVDGREFTILKFRSMRVHEETTGMVTQARKNDSRITPIGRFLRKTSLDELPQFINVLLGHMSVVGPRPHAIEHDDFYMRLIDGYMYRYRIKPGITGWAQINGARGETPQVETMARRVMLDLFYIQNWSFWLDMKIVIQTIFRGFTGKNAY